MGEPDTDRTRRFDAIFRAHCPDVVAYCGWRAGPSIDAQDVVAEVFLAAWRRLDDVPEGHGARLWLYATARRVMANHRRSSRRSLALRDRLTRERVGRTDEVFAAGSADAAVREALRRLRPRDREVLLLAEWEGLSPAEIGVVLGCLPVTARGRLHRARFRFRVTFEELQQKEDDHAHVGHAPRTAARQPAL
jgi:RNA polymerase sigma-70 factor (ECF subfamily)